MASFHALGVIATDLIRRETKRGVLATFRLASGIPGKGQLWIDIEAWGHTAGVLNTHAQTGRGIAVTGRLTHKTWRDKTGAAKSKLVVTANDFDFLSPTHDANNLNISNHVQTVGRIEDHPHPDETGDRILFTITSGQARNKTGRLWLPIETWGRTLEPARQLTKGDHIAIAGKLGYRTRPDHNGEKHSGHELSAYSLAPIQLAVAPS